MNSATHSLTLPCIMFYRSSETERTLLGPRASRPPDRYRGRRARRHWNRGRPARRSAKRARELPSLRRLILTIDGIHLVSFLLTPPTLAAQLPSALRASAGGTPAVPG